MTSCKLKVNNPIIHVSEEVQKELDCIAQKYKKEKVWSDINEAVLLKYADSVSISGLVRMLKKISPNIEWSEDRIRSKIRRLLKDV